MRWQAACMYKPLVLDIAGFHGSKLKMETQSDAYKHSKQLKNNANNTQDTNRLLRVRVVYVFVLVLLFCLGCVFV